MSGCPKGKYTVWVTFTVDGSQVWPGGTNPSSHEPVHPTAELVIASIREDGNGHIVYGLDQWGILTEHGAEDCRVEVQIERNEQ